jgi:transposase
LSKFLLRHGVRAPETVKKAWTQKYMVWMKDHVRFDQPALQATLQDYMREVERIQRLEKAIDEAVSTAPESIRSVVAALQALRGIAPMTAVSIVSELGCLSRFKTPRQLMSYSGLVSSEYSAIAFSAAESPRPAMPTCAA